MTVTIDTCESTPEVRMRGLDVLLDVEIDEAELARRGAQALRLDDMEVSSFGALLQIPAFDSVLTDSLSPEAWRVIRRRPCLVERIEGNRLRRRVSSAVRVDMVTLPVTRWRRGLEAISRFAPYSARRLLLQSQPTDLDVLCMEASYWGVGVRLEHDSGVRDIVHAAPFRPSRYTGASWAFEEQALSAVRPT